MAYFLAIDNGGTKTDYLLADELRELARVRSATIKRMRTDADTATANLDRALAELTAKTGVPMESISRTCIGTAGETVPLVTDWLREAFAARVPGELIVLGDVEIALDAAFHDGPGILVLAGTGSNIAGRLSDGSITGVGGWGPALADQGSGNHIGQQALRAAFLAKDEERTTRLMDQILSFWELRDCDHLVAYANQVPSPDYSRLTHLVARCASEGDEIAGSVLRQEGEDLGYLVRLLIRRMTKIDAGAEETKIAFAGSIMENLLPVRQALIASVRAEFAKVEICDGVVDPILGALWRARLLS